MAGFWKKVAGAFIEFEDKGGQAPASSSDDELAKAEALIREMDSGKSAAKAPLPPPAPPPPPVAGPGTTAVGSAPDVPEGAPFSTFYVEARVPAVYNTAEQMLAILDGLAAMPREASRLAIKAMDDADDRWTVADVVEDGRNKRQALEAVVAKLQGWAQEAESRASAETAEADDFEKQAEQTIQAQIEQLQAELAQFRKEASERRVQTQAALAASRDAVARETARMQSEIYRLSRIEAFFEASPGSAPTIPQTPK
jgi:hypothetical protein